MSINNKENMISSKYFGRANLRITYLQEFY